jgi:hypothetical protein
MTAIQVSWISVGFALLAAALWGWSALANVPVIGSAYAGIDNLEPFYKALKKIARLNFGAAGCAFISALLQAVSASKLWGEWAGP